MSKNDFMISSHSKNDLVFTCPCGNCAFVIGLDAVVSCSKCDKEHSGDRLDTAVRQLLEKEIK